MSYILTALRKSEAERAKGMIPRLSTRHELDVAPGRRGRLWPVIAVMALIFNGVLVAFVLLNPAVLPWPSDRQSDAFNQPVAAVPDAAKSASSSTPRVAAVQAGAVGTDGRTAGVETAGTQSAQDGASGRADGLVQEARTAVPDAEMEMASKAVAASAQSAARPLPEPVQAGAETALAPAAGPSGTGAAQQASGETVTAARTQIAAMAALRPAKKKPLSVTTVARTPKPAAMAKQTAIEINEGAAAKPAPEAILAPAAASAELLAALPEQAVDPYLDVPELWRMPRDFRVSVPKFSISVHVYAPENKHRFIIVDRKKYGEGDRLKSGVTIEAILPAGVVFDLNGQQFKLTSS